MYTFLHKKTCATKPANSYILVLLAHSNQESDEVGKCFDDLQNLLIRTLRVKTILYNSRVHTQVCNKQIFYAGGKSDVGGKKGRIISFYFCTPTASVPMRLDNEKRIRIISVKRKEIIVSQHLQPLTPWSVVLFYEIQYNKLAEKTLIPSLL